MQINSKLSLQIILFLILGLVALLKCQLLEATWEQLYEQVSTEMQQAQTEMEKLERNTLHLKKRSVLKTGSAVPIQNVMSRVTPDSKKIHESFVVALKAFKRLAQSNSSIDVNKVRLRAPPRFCPFSADFSCDRMAKYRQTDGSCNNLENGQLGKSSTPYKRLLKPAYDDNMDEPRRRGVDGENLPNPRSVAIAVHQPLDTPAKISNLGVMFGQYVDHDFALTASTGSGAVAMKCTCGDTSGDCVNIPTPEEDTLNSDQSCIVLTRSGGSFNKFDCTLNAREQTNLLTHWLDLSQTYGSDSGTENGLRSFRNGRLRTSRIAESSTKEHMPKANIGTCVEESGDELCFDSGDTRTSQNLLLVSVHTIWLREHNRIARALRQLNPTWSDENIYQEAKRINTALYQNVLYSEWLPVVLGKRLMSEFNLNVLPSGFFMGYDPNTNPHLSAEFAGAAFRFGHTLVRSTLSKSDTKLKQFSNLTLTDVMLRPVEAYRNGGLDSICRGLLSDSGTSFDPHITDEIHNHLFESNAFGVQTHRFSLTAINIMRGRDHGLPSYNQFRPLANLSKARTFDDLQEIPAETRTKLASIYKNVEDIDAFTGGTSETPFEDGLLGPTFGKIVAGQFRDLKVGDRYYFENGQDPVTRFTLPQLNEIRSTTMSSIICANLDIDAIQLNAFMPISPENPLTSCNNIRKMSFESWRNEPLPQNQNNF